MNGDIQILKDNTFFLIIMFKIFFIISIVLFAILLIAFVVRVYESMGISVASAAAGDVRINAPRIQKLINLNKNAFFDESHMRLDFSQFKHYVVSGNSMLLAGIEDGNLLFVEKKQNDCDNLKYPCVVVLRREHFSYANENSPEFKIRRAWGVYDLSRGDDGLLGLLNAIMKLDEFNEVLQLGESKGCCVNPDDIKNDFLNIRWRKYQTNYPSCRKTNDKNGKVILSTTLDTKRNMIHFSIHPCHCVIGKVVYSFKLKNAV